MLIIWKSSLYPSVRNPGTPCLPKEFSVFFLEIFWSTTNCKFLCNFNLIDKYFSMVYYFYTRCISIYIKGCVYYLFILDIIYFCIYPFSICSVMFYSVSEPVFLSSLCLPVICHFLLVGVSINPLRLILVLNYGEVVKCVRLTSHYLWVHDNYPHI